jgi:hypothetical protein
LEALPKTSAGTLVFGIEIPGYTSAIPNIFTNLSTITNFDINPQIREDCFGPTEFEPDERILSAARMTISTEVVSENG